MVSALDNTTFTICRVRHTQPIYSPIIPSLQDEVYADGSDTFTVACTVIETHSWNKQEKISYYCNVLKLRGKVSSRKLHV
jgi:hypothetical protein